MASSFSHWYTIEGYSGEIEALGSATILSNSGNMYSEGIIANDSSVANMNCFVNTNEKPFILKPMEKIEFQFTINDIVISNLSGSASVSYRVFLKKRTGDYTPA
jgi:hypothetical protein